VSAGHGNLTSAREAAAILAAVERYWPLRPWSLRTRSLRTRSLLPWKLSGELLSGKLGPGTERPVVWLSGEGSTARAAGAGLRCPGLSYAQLAVAGEASAMLAAAVGCTVVPWAAVRRPAVRRRSRIRPSRLRTARRPAAVLRAAVLRAAILPIDLRPAALRSATGELARVLHSRLPGRGRPDGWCGLRAAHDRALRPGAGETRPAGESPRRGSGLAGRAWTAAHAVVTRTPAKPRTPIPRIFVTRQASIAS
jgi:hypothetical protein